MSSGAKVSSIDALESFRSSLLLYLTRSRSVLDEVTQDIVRTRIWLETDRRVHWKRQIRLSSAAAAQAEQELMTARLSGDSGAILDRRRAVAKARDAFRRAEEGRDRVRRWLLRYATDVEARAALPRRLQHMLSNEGNRAVHFLETSAAILRDYAGQEAASGPAASQPDVPSSIGTGARPAPAPGAGEQPEQGEST